MLLPLPLIDEVLLKYGGFRRGGLHWTFLRVTSNVEEFVASNPYHFMMSNGVVRFKLGENNQMWLSRSLPYCNRIRTDVSKVFVSHDGVCTMMMMEGRGFVEHRQFECLVGWYEGPGRSASKVYR